MKCKAMKAPNAARGRLSIQENNFGADVHLGAAAGAQSVGKGNLLQMGNLLLTPYEPPHPAHIQDADP